MYEYVLVYKMISDSRQHGTLGLLPRGQDIYIYIYIDRERDRYIYIYIDRERDIDVDIYIYIEK